MKTGTEQTGLEWNGDGFFCKLPEDVDVVTLCPEYCDGQHGRLPDEVFNDIKELGRIPRIQAEHARKHEREMKKDYCCDFMVPRLLKEILRRHGLELHAAKVKRITFLLRITFLYFRRNL